MHEQHPIEVHLKTEAQRISQQLGGASVVVIAAGSSQLRNLPRTMTASCMSESEQRLRDLLGILQASMQIETLKHMHLL